MSFKAPQFARPRFTVTETIFGITEMPTILVVEDDLEDLNTVKSSLLEEGFTVHTAADGLSALATAREHKPDLVVLDIDLPYESSKSEERLDGVRVLQRLREKSDVAILMLTSTTLSSIKILVLEMGADDYLTKPFVPKELVARVNSILRRTMSSEDKNTVPLTFGNLTIDPGARKAFKDGEEIKLTPIEFNLLLTLARRPGQAFSREQLVERVWKGERYGDERLVDSHMSKVRKKVEDDPSKPKLIITVRGTGYRLEAPDA